MCAVYDQMGDALDKQNGGAGRRRYVWPRYVLAAFIAAVLLAMLWLSFEIRRTERIQKLNAPSAPETSK